MIRPDDSILTELLTVPWRDVLTVDYLGRGGFCNVYQARVRMAGTYLRTFACLSCACACSCGREGVPTTRPRFSGIVLARIHCLSLYVVACCTITVRVAALRGHPGIINVLGFIQPDVRRPTPAMILRSVCIAFVVVYTWSCSLESESLRQWRARHTDISLIGRECKNKGSWKPRVTPEQSRELTRFTRDHNFKPRQSTHDLQKQKASHVDR